MLIWSDFLSLINIKLNLFPSEIEFYFCLGYRSWKTTIFFLLDSFLQRNLQFETFQLQKFEEISMGCSTTLVVISCKTSLWRLITKWCIEGLLSSFAFKIIRMSSFTIIYFMRLSNLFLKEFIFELEISILFTLHLQLTSRLSLLFIFIGLV